MTDDDFQRVVALFQILKGWRDQAAKGSLPLNVGSEGIRGAVILGEPGSTESTFSPEPLVDLGGHDAHHLKSGL